jgi:hypothetical protein
MLPAEHETLPQSMRDALAIERPLSCQVRVQARRCLSIFRGLSPGISIGTLRR